MEKAVKTTTTIKPSDKKFLHDSNTTTAHAIRVYCEERRTGKVKELETALKESRGKVQRYSQKVNDIMSLLGKILPQEQFEEVIQKF